MFIISKPIKKIYIWEQRIYKQAFDKNAVWKKENHELPAVEVFLKEKPFFNVRLSEQMA